MGVVEATTAMATASQRVHSFLLPQGRGEERREEGKRRGERERKKRDGGREG